MTEIELTPSGTRMLLVVWRDGKPPYRDRFDPVSAKARAKIAKEWGVDCDVLSGWCEETRVHGGAKKFAIPGEERPRAGSIRVHAIGETGAEHGVEPSRFVKTVLPSIPADHLAEWVGQEALCCLDVDYHETAPPNPEWLETVILTRLSPQPLAWHFSKSGGLHLFYVAAGDYTADELAACAALRFRSIDRSAGLELKNVVFGPGPHPVTHATDQDTAAGLMEWLGAPEYEETQRDDWLEARGLECGRRYEHEYCPIDPAPGAERAPVLVSESGVYCFRCNGKGLSFGSRRPGYAPWAAILGAPSAGELGSLVRNAAHWGHAKWVMTERYDFPAPLARIAYRAALKAFHGAEPDGVFDPRTDALARVNNGWITIDDSYSYPKDIQPILACFPKARFGDKADPAIVCELNQSKDLSRYGYKSINVVHGCKLAQVFLPDTGVTTVAAVNPDLKASTSRGLPRYVPWAKRMNLDDAWGLVEELTPRLDRTLIRALLVSFGCAQETRAGLHPILFVAGISAAGKTAMTQIACAIMGARVGGEATFDEDPGRFRSQIRDGSQQGPVVVLNELLKDSGRARKQLTTREALDFVLNLTPYSTSHALYKGPVKMGRLPSLVITETVCPPSIRDETQLARRIRNHTVYGEKKDWRGLIAKAGLKDLHLLRALSDQMARACDAILSDVIDEFFSVPSSWDDMADSLGVRTIEYDEEFEDPTPWLRELFRLTCVAPALSGKDAKSYSTGFKRVSRTDAAPGGIEEDLCAVYTKFADNAGANWGTSRRLSEKDWSKILGVDSVVKLDIRGDSSTVYVRFFVGPLKSPQKVNEQIVNPVDWEGPLK